MAGGTSPTPVATPVLFPFEPNGSDPIEETWTFETDIITAHNDRESRRALRRRPAIKLKYRLTTMDLGESGRLAGLLWKTTDNRWYVPLWQHAARITAADNLAKIYSVSMVDHRFTFSGKVLLWRSSGVCEMYDLVDDLVDGIVLANSDSVSQLNYTNLSIAPWSGTAAAVMNQPGLDGMPNAAATLSDVDATFQSRAASWAIPNNNSLHAVHILVKKDAVTNRFPQFRINLSGGSVAQQTGVIVRTDTGAFSTRNTIGAGVISVRDAGDNWLVTLTITNNTSGHTFLSLTIYPATSAVYPGSDDAANTGTIVVPKVMVTLNPHTQLFAPNTSDTFAVPLAIGALAQSYQLDRPNIATDGVVEFEIDSTSSVNVASLDPTQFFRGFEVLNIHPDTDNGSEPEQWTLSSERVGGDLGPFLYRPMGTSPVLVRKKLWQLTSKAERAQFRSWLMTRRGRRVPLWVPTYQDDMTLVASALFNASSIDVAAVNFATLFFGSTARVKIAALMFDRTVMPLVVSSVTAPSAGVERLNLESPTTAAIPLGTRICFLVYARLSEDAVVMEHLNTEVTIVNASFTELPRETPV